MATDCIPQVTFEFYDKLKPVVARFDQAQASTDGGAVLLKALDDRLGMTDAWSTAGTRRKSDTRCAICCGNGSSAWPVGTRTRTTRRG